MKMKNYTKIPNEVLMSSQISVSARYLFCVLLRHCGKGDTCFPGQRHLAYSLGISDRHIRNLINELVEAKIVSVKRTGFNKSNTYKISRDLYRNSSSDPLTSNEKNSSAHLGSAVPLTNGNTVPNNSTQLIEKDNNYFRRQAKYEKMKRKLIKDKTISNSKKGDDVY